MKYFWAQFYKIWTEGLFWTNDPLDEPENNGLEKILSLQENGQNRKMVTKIEFTPSSLRNVSLLIKGLQIIPNKIFLAQIRIPNQ